MERNDLNLEMLFDKQARKVGAGSVYRKADDDVLRLCKTCVLSGPMFKAEELPVEQLAPYKNLPMLNMTQPANADPRIMFSPDTVWLNDINPDSFYMIVSKAPDGDNGVWVLRQVGEATFERVENISYNGNTFSQLGMRLWQIPAELLQGQDFGKSLKPALVHPRTFDMLTLKLQGENSILCASCAAVVLSDPRIVINVGDKSFVTENYDDETKCWKQLKKEKKMKSPNLARPATLNAAAPQAATPVTNANMTQEEKQAIAASVAPVEQPLATAPVAAVPNPVAAPFTAQEPTVETAKGPVIAVSTVDSNGSGISAIETGVSMIAEPEAKPKAKRTTKPNKSVGIDISKMVEELSGGVPDLESDQFDAALNEVRALRDLQQVAASRMANLCAAMHKFSKVAVDKYSAMQQLLK